jgi:hypothetical protein
MNLKTALLTCALFTAGFVQAQNTYRCVVKDSVTQETLVGVSAVVENTTNGTLSDNDGKIGIANLPAGQVNIVFSYLGYKTKTVTSPIAATGILRVVLLTPSEKELEAVTISSTRTNTRIEDLPTK